MAPRDIDLNAPQESISRLTSVLHERSAGPLNQARLVGTLGLSSRSSLDVRLTRLIKTFGAIWCHQVNDKGLRVAGSSSKLYLLDPLIAWLGPRLRAGTPEPQMPVLSESALGVTLARAIEHAQPNRWMSQDMIGYARTGGGNEVDFAPIPVPTAAGTAWTTPVESKWVTQGWRAETRVIAGRYGRGVVATKNIVDVAGDVWALPAPMLAMFLG